MSEDPTMQETPKGHKIPVPTHEQVLADLAKVAKPAKHSAPVDGESGAESK